MARRAIILLLALGSFAFASSASGLSGGRVCGYIRASVPYAAHGNSNRWRVYVAGATTCSSAEKTLIAVMHLTATIHEGRDEADSYVTSGAWHCPFGKMGGQYCEIPARPPYRAETLAVECSFNPCPSSKPPSYFP